MRQKSGDLNRDLEEKESQAGVFESGAPSTLEGHSRGDVEVDGVYGDSRPDRTDPEGAHFVDATEDPNMHVSRRTSEITSPERGSAAELDAIRHDDTKIVARPMGPLGEEGSELRPLSKDAKEEAEGDDS